MNSSFLQDFVPAFCIVFLATISVWAQHRKRKLLKNDSEKVVISAEVRRLDAVFKVLLLSIIAIGLLYGFVPEYYYITMPIDILDHPFINSVGVLTLKASLVWIVWAQLNIDHTLFKKEIRIETITFQRLAIYAQKSLLSGMLLMFIGFAVTISSVVAIFLCVIAFFLFERLLRVA